jgi:alkanesulfonate monooxygenase SsuD/methylene tetrahydromethanopterin reductase-like flavin-dependent oxidoreductase (luciferase family)
LQILGKKDYQTRTYYADPVHSAPLIPDVMTDHMAVAGTPVEITDKLTRIASLGFDQITIRPVPSAEQTLTDCLILFADAVLTKFS